MPPAVDIGAALAHMVEGLRSQLAQKPLMIGIHTGGAWVADWLHQALALSEPLGNLAIIFYRADFTRLGMNPQVKTSNLPVNIDDRHVILVDDVLHTGRTVRAALNEIFDYGRPASVILAALIVRDGRELPIQADIVGQAITLNRHQHIKLVRASNPATPFELTVQEIAG